MGYRIAVIAANALLLLLLFLLLASRIAIDAFSIASPSRQRIFRRVVISQPCVYPSHPVDPTGCCCIRREAHRKEQDEIKAENEENEEENSTVKNPYADPNYPDLEFVNYADPEYSADQSSSSSSIIFDDDDDSSDQTLLEEMREERRRGNDEYQFRTYHRDFCHTYLGEWTTYTTNLLEHPMAVIPTLKEEKIKQTVVSRGEKVFRENSTTHLEIDKEFIRHHQQVQSPPTILLLDTGIMEALEDSLVDGCSTTTHQNGPYPLLTYWPETLQARDFRGEQGIMVCGRAYTICTAVPVNANQEQHVGPFSEYRAEIGIAANDMRFRLKMDYGIISDEPSFLLLKTITVCREARNVWPLRSAHNVNDQITECLFGPPGAVGGLYDPPPLKSEEQAKEYVVMDLEGRATALIPFRMDQRENAKDGYVVSLDWTSGPMRYQVDRKVDSGKNLLRLRTLELSEVLGKDAETYRPRDGGQNMRQ